MEQLQTKLFEAATLNSITSLQQLLIDDQLILERALVNCFNETPLQVATMLGHVDFVRKIIGLQPRLVNELNSQLSSPLHMAAAKGNVAVVKALLSVDNLTCW
ncbi:ankyrin repeat-containing protein BDA1-like [Salvia divinorum]|uniref:Ankyrin repeat-containing protein BDA1-like n=1 Tax=Salvia divinorum TaxID=28513 RepID=A0ABD1FL87_SALDI